MDLDKGLTAVNFAENQLWTGSIGLSPLHPDYTNELHISIASVLQSMLVLLQLIQA